MAHCSPPTMNSSFLQGSKRSKQNTSQRTVGVASKHAKITPAIRASHGESNTNCASTQRRKACFYLASGLLGAGSSALVLPTQPSTAMEVDELYEETAVENEVVMNKADPWFTKESAFEKQLRELRAEQEGAAAARLETLRLQGEEEAKLQQSQGSLLCATPFGVDVVGITQTIGLVGALVGGLAARQSKMEVEELNEKLRTVNSTLRKQARSGITYAPGLNYAPAPENVTPPAPPPEDPQEATEEEAQEILGETETEKIGGPVCVLDEVRMVLRLGKAGLQSGDAGAAMVQFNRALMLARANSNRLQERRATRGLAAAKKMQGDLKGALDDYLKVLGISQELKEYTGDTDALGIVADLYTELGEFELAGDYYDKYITRLEFDDEFE